MPLAAIPERRVAVQTSWKNKNNDMSSYLEDIET
jgi:hypothetical protein